MNHVHVEYERNDEHTTTMKLTSGYGVNVLVDTDLVPKLIDLKWCYDTAKGEVYATDMSMEIPKTLGVTSPRVYLWKYIAFLRTGKVVKAWKDRKFNDYRSTIDAVRHGHYVIEATLEPVSEVVS